MFLKRSNIRRNVCQEPGCKYPVFSHRFCKYHSQKNKPTPKKKFSRTTKKSSDSNQNHEKDSEFYMEIWDERPHVCYETGVILQAPYKTMFHHCLLKSKYPQFRYTKENILLLHPDVHSMVHSNIDKCPRVKEYTKMLKEKLLYGPATDISSDIH